MEAEHKRKVVLTIAGSDCSGGAGIQADIKTLTVHGVYAMSAITAMTAQNTMGVYDIQESSAKFLRRQLESVFTDIFPDAVKVGMIYSKELAVVIYEMLKQYRPSNIVLDPIILSSSGKPLLQEAGKEFLVAQLFPQATLLTPNIPEAELLSGIVIKNTREMENCAAVLAEKYSCSVLIKGGHWSGMADDLLYQNGKVTWYQGAHLNNDNTHGTGCTLSSAIAANLALGATMEESVRKAKQYITKAIGANLNLGHGSGPLDHMVF